VTCCRLTGRRGNDKYKPQRERNIGIEKRTLTSAKSRTIYRSAADAETSTDGIRKNGMQAGEPFYAETETSFEASGAPFATAAKETGSLLTTGS